MPRAALTAVFAVLLANCAHERSGDPEHPAAAATARFIIQAIGPAQSEEYRWDAVARRTSVQWGPPESGAAEGVEVRREGTLSAGGAERRVVALGDRASVGALSIDTNSFHASALVEALLRAGAEVSFQGDYESYSEHVVTPAGGDTALLTTNSTCIPFDPQPGEVCRNYVTLTFNPY